MRCYSGQPFGYNLRSLSHIGRDNLIRISINEISYLLARALANTNRINGCFLRSVQAEHPV